MSEFKRLCIYYSMIIVNVIECHRLQSQINLCFEVILCMVIHVCIRHMLSPIDTGLTECRQCHRFTFLRSSWNMCVKKTKSQSTKVRFHLGRLHRCQPNPDLLLPRESRLHALYVVDEWLNKTLVSDYMDLHELKWKTILYIVSDTCVSFIYRWHPTVFHVSVWIAFGVIPEGYC